MGLTASRRRQRVAAEKSKSLAKQQADAEQKEADRLAAEAEEAAKEEALKQQADAEQAQAHPADEAQVLPAELSEGAAEIQEELPAAPAPRRNGRRG